MNELFLEVNSFIGGLKVSHSLPLSLIIQLPNLLAVVASYA
jgi:hypothetical protein